MFLMPMMGFLEISHSPGRMRAVVDNALATQPGSPRPSSARTVVTGSLRAARPCRRRFASPTSRM